MSNFAIKGHSTRGKEIIEILQMFGGINKYNITYTEDNLWYCLRSKDNVIIATYPNSSIKTVLSLEKFLEKFNYKLNELVLCDNGLLGIITKMEWDCEKSDMRYYISFNTPVYNKWYYSKNIKCKFMAEKDKKLAIKGHVTRGKEVIELLEMMGGKNTYGYTGDMESLYFSIYSDSIVYGSDRSFLNDNYVFFTLEEFLEKYPFKVGDKVIYTSEVFTIIGMKWDCCRNIVIYTIRSNDSIINCYDSTWIKPYKEETMESKPNLLQQLKEYFNNTPRDIIEKEWNELSYLNEIGPTVNEYLECVKKYSLPEGYEFHDDKGNVINTSTIELVKKQPEYPKTIIEVLNFWHPDRQLEDDYQRCYKKDLIEKFQDILYARDAYWKIAGEQMGLGKPWEPDTCQIVYSIGRDSNRISFCNDMFGGYFILEFPTVEMRDAFYENFKELIESCKELL